MYMFMYSFVQHAPHESLVRFHFFNTLIHTILIISYHNVISSSSYLIISHPPYNMVSNSACTVAIHFALPSSLPRAAVSYSPASFFALSRLLIDRSRRKTLHTLQISNEQVANFTAKEFLNLCFMGSLAIELCFVNVYYT